MMTIVRCSAAMRCFSLAAIIAALALLLAGCSALRLAYDQGPDLAYWWLDGYADFDETQTPRVREALGEWFGWHRRTQLGDYAALLARAETEIMRDATAAQMCRWDAAVRERIATAFDAAVPSIAAIAPSLTPQQIEHIDKRFAKRNAEFRENYRLDDDAAAQLRASVKRAVERAEMLYGRLDEAQRERIRRGVAASPFDAALWLDERRARQADILATLSRLRLLHLPQREAEAAVRAVAENVVHSPRADYRAYERTLTQYNCTLAAGLHNATTTAQRERALRKLKGYETDLRALMDSADALNSPPPAAPRRGAD
jgi:hypothetical protein